MAAVRGARPARQQHQQVNAATRSPRSQSNTLVDAPISVLAIVRKHFNTSPCRARGSGAAVAARQSQPASRQPGASQRWKKRDKGPYSQARRGTPGTPGTPCQTRIQALNSHLLPLHHMLQFLSCRTEAERSARVQATHTHTHTPSVAVSVSPSACLSVCAVAK